MLIFNEVGSYGPPLCRSIHAPWMVSISHVPQNLVLVPNEGWTRGCPQPIHSLQTGAVNGHCFTSARLAQCRGELVNSP